MTFTPGHKRSKGRPKGSTSLRTLGLLDSLDKHKFDPITAMIYIHNEALKNYENYKERFQANRISPMEDNSHKFLKIAADMAREFAGYAYPKLKAIEQQINVTAQVDQEKKVGLLYEKVRAILDKPKEIEVQVEEGNGSNGIGT